MAVLRWTLQHSLVGDRSAALVALALTGGVALRRSLPLIRSSPTRLNTSTSAGPIEHGAGHDAGADRGAWSTRSPRSCRQQPEVAAVYSRASKVGIGRDLRHAQEGSQAHEQPSSSAPSRPHSAAIPDARVVVPVAAGRQRRARHLASRWAATIPTLLEADRATSWSSRCGACRASSRRASAAICSAPRSIIKPRIDLAADLGVTTAGAVQRDPHRDARRYRPEQRQILAVRSPDPDPRRARTRTARRELSTIQNLPVPTATRRIGAAVASSPISASAPARPRSSRFKQQRRADRRRRSRARAWSTATR